MKYPEKFKDYVRSKAKEYKLVIGAGEYNMDIYWEEEEEQGNHFTAAKIKIRTEYLFCNLHIHPPLYDYFKNKDLNQVDRIILHEMCHVLTEPFYEVVISNLAPIEQTYFEQIRERQTQRIANAIIYANPEIISKL